MNILKYMESGIVEAYCLGQLTLGEMRKVELLAQRYPAIQGEIARTHATLRALATETPVLRTRKETILHTLQQLRMEQEMSLAHLPLLTPYSDYRQWLAVVGALQPTDYLEDIDFCTLQETPHLVQTLIWMKTAIAEEGHEPDTFLESFLVLEGECECDLGGEVIRLGAGGYVAIPPSTPHIIRNLHTDRLLLGVMQRYRTAA